jgi:glycosyltransferase involved in cell wall biosynthesis
MKVAVVTPTIGSIHLSQCLQSVDEQTYEDLTHYVFIDGEKEHGDKVWHQLEGATRVKTIRLEENVGKGWYGHRVYAACSFLVNADIICYLDEDNWFDPCHVKKLVNTDQMTETIGHFL